MATPKTFSPFEDIDEESLTRLLRPLAECIIATCSGGTKLCELIPVNQVYGHDPHDNNSAFIEIVFDQFDQPPVRERLAHSIRSLLQKATAERSWTDYERVSPSNDGFVGPIRFSVQTFAWGYFDQVFAARYLVAECRDLDRERYRAKRQIDLLVEFLPTVGSTPESRSGSGRF